MKKDIKGYEGLYSISDTGLITAYDRIVKMPNGGVKIIKQHMPVQVPDKKGYLKIWLTSKNGIRKMYRVHRLVLENFIGKSKLQCNHKDKNKKNNGIKNLEWVTNKENTIHRIDKSKTSSRYTGVTKLKSGKFMAQKQENGKYKYLGVYKTEKDAHNAYLGIKKLSPVLLD